MAMLTVYCDESGTDRQSRVAVVAGYVSRTAQWDLFNREWREVLKDFHVSQMHRADLEAFRGEFSRDRGWNEKRRISFLQKLHSIVRRRTIFPLGTAVIKEDYESVMPDQVKKKFGGVYGWCAQACLVKVRIWCNRPSRRHNTPIVWVFEAGPYSNQVEQMFSDLCTDPRNVRKEWLIGSWSFGDKSIVPLQSADLLAYECFKHIENQVVDQGEKFPIRFSLRDLMRHEPGNYLDYWDKQRLAEWVETWTSGPK